MVVEGLGFGEELEEEGWGGVGWRGGGLDGVEGYAGVGDGEAGCEGGGVEC